MAEIPADAVARLPHTRTARLLTTIEKCGDGVIEAWGCVPAFHPLARKGLAPAFIAIEIGAQAAAALEAISRASAGDADGVPAGRLVRVREARIHQALITVDAPVRVTARQIAAAPPLAIYQIEATIEERPLLDAAISTWRTGGPEAGRA